MARYYSVMTHHPDCITFQVPGLPGFIAQIDTTDAASAIAEAESVLADYLGVIADSGRAVPAPLGFIEGAAIAKAERMADPDAGLETACAVLVGRPRAAEPVRVNISLTSDVLDEIDEHAKARGLTRSAYLAAAAREFA